VTATEKIISLRGLFEEQPNTLMSEGR